MKAILKPLVALMLISSMAFAAMDDIIFVSEASSDWLPKDNKISFKNANNANYLELSDNKNYVMDIGGTSPLRYGNGQFYTIGLVNPKKKQDTAGKRGGYIEVIIDMNMAKSILASEVQKDGKLREYIGSKKATPPSIYGKHKSDGLNFFLVSKKSGTQEDKGINYGRCKDKGNAGGESIDQGKEDVTARQFKIIIPDCDGNCNGAFNNNIHYLTIRTDSKYTDCQTQAKINDDTTKSHIYGIRMSVKRVNEPYVGYTESGLTGFNPTKSDARSTYNLPTLIIGREDVLPEFCTQGMRESGQYFCYTGDGETLDNNDPCVGNCQQCKTNPNGQSCKNCKDQQCNFTNAGVSKKSQLLWAACGQADNIKDELDCRKTGARCENRIKNDDRSFIIRDWDHWREWLSGRYGNRFDFSDGIENAEKHGYPTDDVNHPNLYFMARCWRNSRFESTIYSSGYYFLREQYTEFDHYDAWWGCERELTRGDCHQKIGGENCKYRHFVKTPKLFTLSLREYTNRAKTGGKLPDFEAKFRIVNASTETGGWNSAPKISYFKNKQAKCYVIGSNGNKQGGDKNIPIEVKGWTDFNNKAQADEMYFTIKSKDFKIKDGKEIQCLFEYSDYQDNKKDWPNNDWNAFSSSGLYYEFAYNFQLASLKILNTTGASYKDLSLNTKCSFPTSWTSKPGRVYPKDNAFADNGMRYTNKVKTYNYSSKHPAQVKSAQRHFRFDARPLYYTATKVDGELYAGYKYPENKGDKDTLNSKAELAYLDDKKENEKLKSINFNKSKTGEAKKITIKAVDANGYEIQGLNLKANLKGLLTSTYARYDELSYTEIPYLDLVKKDECYLYGSNGKCVDTFKNSPYYIDNCFTANVCRSVWGDANGVNPSFFVYTDSFENKRYLAYDNAGKTILALRDSDFTLLSQNLKTTHSDHPEPLCALDEVGSVYRHSNSAHGDFRTKGKGYLDSTNFNKLSSDEKKKYYVYGCDIAVIDESKNAISSNKDSFYSYTKAEWEGLPFYSFKPAMIKINAVLGSGALNNNPYHSNKFLYNRAKCAEYSDPTNCDDSVENSAFKIQVGATGASKADILANNFLSRYDGTAMTSKRVLVLNNLLNPKIAHQKLNSNDILVKDDFRFKIKSKNLDTLYLAPKCNKFIEINGDTGAIKVREKCESGNQINNTNYIAKGEGSKLVYNSNDVKSKYGQMNDKQTYWQDLVQTPAKDGKQGVADITMYANGFVNGMSELKNVKKGDKTKGEQDQEIGLVVAQGFGKYSLKPAEPVRAEGMLEDLEVTTDAPNQWLKTKGVSVMYDSFGAAVILDVTLIAPNKEVGINKDNAVFLAAYSSDKEVAKSLQKDGILGDIIPGYANYYRIRRDAFSNVLADSFFNYENANVGLNATNMQSGDFLTINDVTKPVKVKLKGDDKKIAKTYCNFIRECYPLDANDVGTQFRGFENANTNWTNQQGQGSTILDKARTRPTQRRIAW